MMVKRFQTRDMYIQVQYMHVLYSTIQYWARSTCPETRGDLTSRTRDFLMMRSMIGREGGFFEVF